MNSITTYFKRRKALKDFADKYLMPRPQPDAPAPLYAANPSVTPAPVPQLTPPPQPPVRQIPVTQPEAELPPTPPSYPVSTPGVVVSPQQQMVGDLNHMVSRMPTAIIPSIDDAKRNLIREVRR